MKNMKRLLEFRRPMAGELLSFRNKEYYVSKGGMVYDDARKRFVKQHEINSGYMAVNLRDDNGKQHTGIMVHNLVATCYIRLLNKGENCHHVDKNPRNNNLSNLELITASEHSRMHGYDKWMDGTMNGMREKLHKARQNGRYKNASEKMKKAWKAGRIKTRNVGNDYNPAKLVVQLTLDGRFVKVWPSTRECHRNGWNRGAVGACCRNCYNRTGNSIYKGFKWMYLSDYQNQQKDKETSHLEQLVSS